MIFGSLFSCFGYNKVKPVTEPVVTEYEFVIFCPKGPQGPKEVVKVLGGVPPESITTFTFIDSILVSMTNAEEVKQCIIKGFGLLNLEKVERNW